MRICLGLLVGFVVDSSPVFAGTVEQALIVAEPQMQVQNGAVDGCGLLLRSIALREVAGGSALVLEASFNLYKSGLGAMKGGSMDGRNLHGAPSFSVRPIEGFWLKAEGLPVAAPVAGKVLPAQTRGYLLYGIDLEAFSGLLSAVMEGRQITIGARVKGEPVERIHTGIAKLNDADKAQTVRCVGDLLKEMEGADTTENENRAKK